MAFAASREPEVRFLFEVPGQSPTVQGQISAARALDAWLLESEGAYLSRLHAVADLFLPDDWPLATAGEPPSFGLWHAAVFAPDGSRRFKVYLDPYAHGRARSADRVACALARLGNPGAWNAVARLCDRGPELDELRFFSLDLGDDPEARVKVYVSRREVHADALFGCAALAQHTDASSMRLFLDAVTGGHQGFFNAERPIVTCFDFIGDDPRPRHFTMHVPIRAYAPNDQEARARITVALRALGHATDAFDAAADAFARRDLSTGSGLFSYASFRAEAAGPRLTAYFATEAFRVGEVHRGATPMTHRAERPIAIDAFICRYEEEPMTWHPFLQRLAREPVSMERLCLLLHNFRVGITRDFSPRLLRLVARIDEEPILSLLVKQLNDELGAGDPTRTHRLLFERFVDGMDMHRPAALGDRELLPGRTFGRALESLHVERDPYEGLGAAIMSEVFGKQVDQFLGEQFRRAHELPPAVMEWLSLHETLEVDHVYESFEVASHVPPGPKTDAVVRGARDLVTAAWRFFDDMHRVAWGE